MDPDVVRSRSSVEVIDIALKTEGLSLSSRYELLHKKMLILNAETGGSEVVFEPTASHEDVIPEPAPMTRTLGVHEILSNDIEGEEDGDEEDVLPPRLSSSLYRDYQRYGSYGRFSYAIHSDLPGILDGRSVSSSSNEPTVNASSSSPPHSPTPCSPEETARPPSEEMPKRRFTRRMSTDFPLRSPSARPPSSPVIRFPEPPTSSPYGVRSSNPNVSIRIVDSVDNPLSAMVESLLSQLAKANEQIHALLAEKCEWEREREHLLIQNRQPVRHSQSAVVQPKPTPSPTFAESYVYSSTYPLAPLQRPTRTPGSSTSSPRRALTHPSITPPTAAPSHMSPSRLF